MQAFNVLISDPGNWKDKIFEADQNENLTMITKPTSWRGKVIRWFIHLLSLDSSLKKIQQLFERSKDSFVQQMGPAEPKMLKEMNPEERRNFNERVKKICHANGNILQLNEKIERYNSRTGVFRKIPTIASIPLPFAPPQKPDPDFISKKNFAAKLIPDEHYPDMNRLNSWVEEQHFSFQPVTFALAQSVLENYVPFADFVKALDETTQIVEKKIEDRSFGIVVDKEATKSGRWVSQLAQFSRVPNANKTHTSLESLSDQEAQIRDWVVIDDASYSALQMSNILSTMIDGLNKNIPEGEIRIYVAIPYMSPFAMERLLSKATPRIKILLANSRQLTQVIDVVNDVEGKANSEIKEKLQGYLYLKPSGLTLNYFAHKIGDRVSFEPAVKAGVIFKPSHFPHWQRPIIEDFIPHYRYQPN